MTINFKGKTLAKVSLMALAATPLVVSTISLYPFVTGKAAFIRGAVALFVIGMALHFWESYRKKTSHGVDFSRLKTPIFLSVLAFFVLAVISTVFAEVSYLALWGNIDRGEGLLILIYMLVFLVGVVTLFERKDWTNFFKITLGVGLIIAGDVLYDFFVEGIERPNGFFIGNPAFVSANMLFVIFAALVVWLNVKSKWWRILSFSAALFSIATIFVCETRGAFMGLVAGVVAFAVWGVLKGKGITLSFFGKKLSARTVSIVFLGIVIIFAGVFLITKDNPFWQRVILLDRVAQISYSDGTTQTRLGNIGMSLESVSPENVGLMRSAFGWGPDNFEFAYGKYYDPALQQYDPGWFDRAHNKILDVLVMHGVFGLLSYLAIWVFLFMRIFSKNGGGVAGASAFFAVAFFVQNLFVFDQITNYIPLYAFIGFVIHETASRSESTSDSHALAEPKLGPLHLASFVTILAVILVAALVWLSIIPMLQMKTLIDAARGGQSIASVMDKITQPNNYAQSEVRYRLLSLAAGALGPKDALDPVLKVITLEEEVIGRSAAMARAYQTLGVLYTNISKVYSDRSFLSKGEDALRKSLEIALDRQETMFFLADNLVAQGKSEEALVIADEIYNIAPEGANSRLFWASVVAPHDIDGSRGALERLEEIMTFYLEGKGRGDKPSDTSGFIRQSYRSNMSYFFSVKDSAGFVTALEQAIKIEDVIEKVSAEQLDKGTITKPISSEKIQLINALNLFRVRGWDAIQVGTSS